MFDSNGFVEKKNDYNESCHCDGRLKIMSLKLYNCSGGLMLMSQIACQYIENSWFVQMYNLLQNTFLLLTTHQYILFMWNITSDHSFFITEIFFLFMCGLICYNTISCGS